MAEFTRMGEHLPDDLIRKTNTPTSPNSTDRSPSTESLQGLRPTHEYTNALERAMSDLEHLLQNIAALKTAPDDLSKQKLREAELRVPKLRANIARLDALELDAITRDGLQESRPDGCWCLGRGATGERYVPDLQGGGIPVRTEYCSCPAGIAARAEDDRIRDAYRRGLRRARLDRYFGSARVPARYADSTFDTFPATPDTALIVERLRGYTASCGVSEGPSILIWGKYGVGKTGLAIATMRAVIEVHGLDAFFATVPDLLNEIRSSFRPAARLPYADNEDAPTQMSAGQLQQLVRETSLLVLDDLGAERVTDWVEEALFALINHRHNRMLRTIFTSNLSTTELAQHLGQRTAWRIVAMSEQIKIDGPNLRIRDGRADVPDGR